MSDDVNNVTPDPEAIATEVYLLDALLMHAQAVANQFAFRKKPQLAQALMVAVQPILQLRQAKSCADCTSPARWPGCCPTHRT